MMEECQKFDRIQKLLTAFLNIEEADEVAWTPALVHELIDDAQSVQAMIDREGLFSKNEVIQDMNNQQIKFLLNDYYLGILFQQMPSDPQHRAEADTADMHKQRMRLLRKAATHFHAFLDRCEDVGLIDEKKRNKHMQEVSGTLSSDDARMQKIQKFKEEREVKKLLEEIVRRQRMQKCEDNERDNLERERWLLLLDLAIRHTLEEEKAIAQELEMLTKIAEMVADNGGHLPQDSDLPQSYENRPGITVTRINPLLEMKREIIRSTAFQPSHRMPTMSLQEYADQELADVKDRQAREKEEPTAPKRYDQLEAAGEEDDFDKVDIASYRDRAWDAWKDDNPRGVGNKKGSQF